MEDNKPIQNSKIRIGVVDTTFSRVNMGAIALDEFKVFRTLKSCAIPFPV